ncbi:MAG: succinate dehydrogenase assembly factor 2 [Gammaproteobacteria bacterium]|nr:succinate dehydrogenase assembly factor 2 [Gammaproteobacteria bacterium]
MVTDEEMARLRWRCRRGLLELDLVFEQFIRHQYPSLGPELKDEFWLLLDEADNAILAWLNGSESCTDSGLNKIIKKIREDIDYQHKKIKET